MKNIRRRLLVILAALVLGSSFVTLVIYWVLVSGFVPASPDNVRYLFVGYALKEIILCILAIATIVTSVIFISRRTASPIMKISEAANELAKGNFDIELEETDRKDEIGELTRQFNIMIKELRSNEYLKKDFITNVSHEFKTPLAIINGYARLLTEEDLPDENRKEYAALIARESSRLSDLAGNILLLSKLNNDTIQLNRQPLQLDEQIRQTILLLEQKWSKKGIRFQLHLPEAPYEGDESLLSEIWLNILDNAIKFSPDNSLIDISLLSTRYTYTVYIRDQGTGMDAETCRHVFDQFYQGDTSHKKDGTGLGLSIALKIAQLHGGRIECSSEPGNGTTFRVFLKKTTIIEPDMRPRKTARQENRQIKQESRQENRQIKQESRQEKRESRQNQD